VKDEDSLHDVADAVGAVAEFPQEAPALQGGGHGLFSDTAAPARQICQDKDMELPGRIRHNYT
jgi:hypothetical protein